MSVLYDLATMCVVLSHMSRYSMLHLWIVMLEGKRWWGRWISNTTFEALAMLTPSTAILIRRPSYSSCHPISDFGILETVLRYLDLSLLATFVDLHEQELRSLKARHCLFVKASSTYLYHDSIYSFTSEAPR
jgi:hypothetical protein